MKVEKINLNFSTVCNRFSASSDMTKNIAIRLYHRIRKDLSTFNVSTENVAFESLEVGSFVF